MFGHLKAAMSSATTADFLEEVLAGNLKGTVQEVLSTCEVVARAKEALTEQDFRELRDRSPYTEKVWSKVLQGGWTSGCCCTQSNYPPELHHPPQDPLPTTRNSRRD